MEDSSFKFAIVKTQYITLPSVNTDSGKLVKSVHAKTGIGVHGKTSMGVHGRPESVFTLGRNMHGYLLY